MTTTASPSIATARRPLRVLCVANWDFRREPAPWARRRIEALRRAGAEVDVLDEECVLDRRGFVRLWRALRRRTADARYDVVAPLYGSVLGLLCAAQRRVPCALALAGSDLNGTPEPDGGFRWRSLPGQLATQLATVLAGSTSVRTHAMREALWWPPARRAADVFPDGVDVARFRPRDRTEARLRRGLAIAGSRVGFVARPASRPEKRLPLARAAVALLDGVTLDVLEDVPHAEMPLAYAALDALVLTSHREGSPNCVKEALACGVPVVAVDVGDVREMLDGLTNCAVVPAEPRALAAALGRALADGRRCPDGPARVAERYASDAIAERFLRSFARAARL